MRAKLYERGRYDGKDRKELQAALRNNGFRSTEGRLKLLSILKSADRPLSVPDVSVSLRTALNFVNVYRSLEALTKRGLLLRSDLRSGGASYEYPHSHHHHLVCNDCGRTEDVTHCTDRRIEEKVLRDSHTFASVDTHALEFFGLCKQCAIR